MKTGRKSLLFGVHQFIWHPITVWLAWRNLYGRPSFKESICIIIHDWGYWFTPNMDGPEGEKHPEVGARIAGKLFGKEYYNLVLLHSRHYARLIDKDPSRLCWADKLSILYDPKWFYLIRAISSGEIHEYRQHASHQIPLTASHSIWFDWLKPKFIKLAAERRGDAVPYSRHWPNRNYFYDHRRIMDLSYRKERSQQRNR
jgi:hypothetical protein